MSIFLEGSDVERLVARCRKQDSEAWAKLVTEFQALVYSIPRRYGLGEDDAADVFQNTFQALFKNLDRIESGQALPKWLAVTAAREAMRLKRVSKRTLSTEDGPLGLDELVASEEASAEAEAIRSDAGYRLRRAIGAMQARCRDLLTVLYLEEEESYAVVGERLGMPVGAIGPTRARCLEKLRKTLEAQQFFGK